MSTTTSTTTTCPQVVTVFETLINSITTRLNNTGCLPKAYARKRPTTLDTDSYPIIIVAPLSGETIRFEAFGYIAYDYSVSVSLVQAGNRQFTAGLGNDLSQRETVRQALTGVTLPGSTVVWDTNIQTLDPMYVGLRGGTATYQVNPFIATYSTWEQRINLY